MRTDFWTQEDNDWLVENYKLGTAAAVEHLGRSPSAIRNRRSILMLDHLGPTPNAPKSEFEKESVKGSKRVYRCNSIRNLKLEADKREWEKRNPTKTKFNGIASSHSVLEMAA
jgi:hypothetical protein